MKAKWMAFSSSIFLAACALTPEQQAARAAEQKRAEQALQVHLAAQCDMETAELMEQQFNGAPITDEKEYQAFRLRYVEKVNDPMFQSCYKMAWQNYSARQELRRMRHYYDWHDRFYPWYRPFWGW